MVQISFFFFADTVRELKKCFNLTSSLGVYCDLDLDLDLDLGSFPSLLCRTSGGRGSGSGSGPSTRMTGSRSGLRVPLVGRWVEGSTRTGTGQLRNLHRL